MKKTTLVSLFLLIVATATFGQETTGYVKCGIGGKEVYLLDSPPNWTAVATLKCGDRHSSHRALVRKQAPRHKLLRRPPAFLKLLPLHLPRLLRQQFHPSLRLRFQLRLFRLP